MKDKHYLTIIIIMLLLFAITLGLMSSKSSDYLDACKQQNDSISKAYIALENAETTTEITIDSSSIIQMYIDNHPVVINNINTGENMIDSLISVINNIDTSFSKIPVVNINDSLQFKGGTMFYSHIIKGFLLQSNYDFRIASIKESKIVYVPEYIDKPIYLEDIKSHVYGGINISPAGIYDLNILYIRQAKVSYELGYHLGNTYPIDGSIRELDSWERLKIGIKYKIW